MRNDSLLRRAESAERLDIERFKAESAVADQQAKTEFDAANQQTKTQLDAANKKEVSKNVSK